MSNFKIKGVLVEVIQIFTDCVLVEDPISKNIFIIEFSQIENSENIEYSDNLDSNVVSMEGWVQGKQNIASRKSSPARYSKCR